MKTTIRLLLIALLLTAPCANLLAYGGGVAEFVKKFADGISNGNGHAVTIEVSSERPSAYSVANSHGSIERFPGAVSFTTGIHGSQRITIQSPESGYELTFEALRTSVLATSIRLRKKSYLKAGDTQPGALFAVDDLSPTQINFHFSRELNGAAPADIAVESLQVRMSRGVEADRTAATNYRIPVEIQLSYRDSFSHYLVVIRYDSRF